MNYYRSNHYHTSFEVYGINLVSSCQRLTSLQKAGIKAENLVKKNPETLEYHYVMKHIFATTLACI